MADHIPGEIVDPIPEEVSLVQAGAVPDADFVVLNKAASDMPPDSTDKEPDKEASVEKAKCEKESCDEDEDDLVEKSKKACDEDDMPVKLHKAFEFLRDNSSAWSDEIRGGLSETLLHVLGDVAATDARLEKSFGGLVDAKLATLAERVATLEARIEKAAENPVEPSEEVILEKAAEIKTRQRQAETASAEMARFDAALNALVAHVGRISDQVSRASGQDT